MELFVTVVIFSRVCKLRFLSWDNICTSFEPRRRKKRRKEDILWLSIWTLLRMVSGTSLWSQVEKHWQWYGLFSNKDMNDTKSSSCSSSSSCRIHTYYMSKNSHTSENPKNTLSFMLQRINKICSMAALWETFETKKYESLSDIAGHTDAICLQRCMLFDLRNCL